MPREKSKAPSEKRKAQMRAHGKKYRCRPGAKERKAEATKKYREANREKLRAAGRERYHENKKKLAPLTAAYQKTPRGKAVQAVCSAKARAKEKGLPFSLTSDWLIEKFEHGVCELTDLPFDFSPGMGPRSPSLDRTDSSKGYTRDNCKVILHAFNIGFQNWDKSEVLALWEALTLKENCQ